MSKIMTLKGRYFDFNNPDAFIFDIEEIAHSLSLINRYVGHTNEGYSVAQHSVEGSYLIDEQYALDFLMHDATEHVMGDCNTILKNLLPEYRAIESRIEHAIAWQFGLEFPHNEAVKECDMKMLVTEMIQLRGVVHEDLQHIQPYDIILKPRSAKYSEWKFLERYYDLVNKRSKKVA